MPKISISTGIILILLGLFGYYAADQSDATSEPSDQIGMTSTESGDEAQPDATSITALIPAFLGVPMLLCGLLSFRDAIRMHAMHVAALLGLIGFLLGLVLGVMNVGKFLSGDPSLNQRGFLYVWAMAVVCGVFMFLAIQSFRKARMQREATET